MEPFSWDLPADEVRVRELSQACQQIDRCRNIDDSLLWAAVEGRANAWWDPSGKSYLAVCPAGRLEILVHPELRGQGVGTMLLRHGLDRIQQFDASTAKLWAYGDKARTVAWATKHGFDTERVLYRLDRTWSAVAPPDWPSGWSVRPFEADDAPAWHQLHCSLQTVPERAWSREALARQLQDPLTPASAFALLWEGESLRGYLWLKQTEIFLFAVDPQVRGQGVGAKLLSWALHRLASPAFVYCDDQRPAALALYRKFGFEESARDRCLTRSFVKS